jgi:hypothetical protein
MATNNSPVEGQREELKNRANKSIPVALLLSVFISPLAYHYIGKRGLAVVNLFTLNYLLLGIVVVPIHVVKLITDARSELNT